MKRPEMFCIVCDKHISDGTYIHGTIWRTYGNYGSTILDLGFNVSDPSHLELGICDDCIAKKSDKLISVYIEKTETREYKTGYDYENTKWMKKPIY